MSSVYLTIPGAPDRLLGHVDDAGRVSRSQAGLDDEIGHVNLVSGEVYATRFGPDKKVGHVDLGSGHVYGSRFGPDEYVGQVGVDGRMHRHQALAADADVGHVDAFRSHAHTAAAMLLLVLPALVPHSAADESPAGDDGNTVDPGGVPQGTT